MFLSLFVAHVVDLACMRIREFEDSSFQYFVLNMFMETSSKQTNVNHLFCDKLNCNTNSLIFSGDM